MIKEITIDVEKLAEEDRDLEILLNEIQKKDNIFDLLNKLKEENEHLRKENARFKRMLENLGYKVVIVDE